MPNHVSASADAKLSVPWLDDLREQTHSRGRLDTFDDFAAFYVKRSKDTLVVSFDHIFDIDEPIYLRQPWGYSYFKKHSFSHLGILAHRKNWYRDEQLFEYFDELIADGFFDGYKSVVFTGTSMGGYAALALSSIVPGSVVVAYSPQTTLREDLAPWETRYGYAKKEDWSGRYNDAAAEIETASKVYVIYDPYFLVDRRHAERITGSNVHKVHCHYSGHFSVFILRKLKILDYVMGSCIRKEFDDRVFYGLYRKRLEARWYLKGLAKYVEQTGGKRRLSLFIKVLRRKKRWFLIDEIKKEYGL